MANNIEHYSPEEAAEEAFQIQKKVKSGEARSYEQAELMVEREKSRLSVEGIRGYTQELKSKIEATKVERARHIEQKLQDREELIREVQTTAILLGEAREALDYYTAMRDLGELKDPKDVAKLEELRTLVLSLDSQSQDIIGRSERISSQPEILEKLRDKAKSEDLERKSKNISEQGKAELLPQIEQVFEKIKNLAGERKFLYGRRERNEQGLESAQSKLYSIIDNVKEMLRHQGKGDLLSELDIMLRSVPQALALYQKIVVMRQELGVFKGKEKAALDKLIAIKKEFVMLDEKQKEAASIQRDFEGFNQKLAEAAEQYREVIIKGWNIDEQVKELGIQNPRLVYDLSRQLEEQVDAFALQKITRDGGYVDEKYSNKSSSQRARFHPDNEVLASTFSDVYNKAGGQNLHYTSPKEHH